MRVVSRNLVSMNIWVVTLDGMLISHIRGSRIRLPTGSRISVKHVGMLSSSWWC